MRCFSIRGRNVAARAVIAVLCEAASMGEIETVRSQFPNDIRQLFMVENEGDLSVLLSSFASLRMTGGELPDVGCQSSFIGTNRSTYGVFICVEALRPCG